MTVPDVHLHPSDATELSELLLFLDDWLATDHKLDASLTRFVGNPSYDLTRLRDDLTRFAFLLGADTSPYPTDT